MALSRRRLIAGLGVLAAGRAAAGPRRRIVTVGGAITEIAYALGRQDWIVGVDSTSLHPAAALAEKPNIGYMRALSAEGILSLQPELVLAIEGAGPPDVLKLLGEARVPVEMVAEATTEAGVIERIVRVGATFDAQEAAARLAQDVRAGFERLALRRQAGGPAARVMFVLSMQNGRVLVGGRNSAADAMIRMAGGVNAADAVEGYKALSDEGVVAARPDVILTMKAGAFSLPADQVFAHEAFRITPAAQRRALVTMDGLYLLGFGPRTHEAALELSQRIAEASGAGGGRR